MRTYKQGLLLATALVSGVSISASARAQDAATVFTLETVTVTAEKFAQDLQKSAIAVTAVSGADIQARGQQSFADILRNVPSVQIREEVGATRPTVVIRGVQPVFGTDASVNVNVDGVYQQSGASPIYDLARVEVLKGPQGTLYGRNALGGVVNIVNNDPMDMFGASVRLTYGNYRQRRVEAVINTPLTDQILSRTAGYFSRHDGYLSNGNNDEDIQAVRQKLLFRLSEDLSITATGEFVRVGGHGAGNVAAPLGGTINYTSQGLRPAGGPPLAGAPSSVLLTPGTFPIQLATSPTLPGGAIVSRPSNPWYSETIANQQRIDRKAANVVVDWDAGWTIVHFQSAYEDIHFLNAGNAQGVSAGGTQSIGGGEGFNVNMTEELRFSSPEDSPVRWQAGGYYSRFRTGGPITTAESEFLIPDNATFGISNNQPGPPGPPPPFSTRSKQNGLSTTRAVFGQVTYPVTDEFRLTGGLRYTSETISRDFALYQITGNGMTAMLTGGPPTATLAQSATFTALTWKAAAEYDLAPDSLLYAGVSRGFKSGGFNTADDTTHPTYRPEFVTAYEIGSKNEFLDQTLRINLDAYYYDNSDKQFQTVGPCIFATFGASCPIPNIVTLNTGQTTMYGVELQASWLFTPSDQIDVGVAWAHSAFGGFLQATPARTPGEASVLGYIPGTDFIDPITGRTTPLVACPVNVSSNLVCFDREGQQLPNSPEWTETIAYTHTFDFSDGGTLSASGNIMFVSGHDTDLNIDNNSGLDQYQPAYHMWGANIQYTSPDGNWTLSLYGNNLGNEAVRQRTFPGTRVWLQSPRTFGVILGAKI